MDAMENMFLQLRTAGNPGAMRFAEEFCYSHGDEVRDLNLFLNEVEKCQSDDFPPKPLPPDRIYMVWNDCCGKDCDRVVALVSAAENGSISYQSIAENLSRVRANYYTDEELGLAGQGRGL